MSEIRKLLASAQEAEVQGRKVDAVRLLRDAAAWYRDRKMLERAAQMLRQARRVEGVVADESGDAVFGFGPEFDEEIPAAMREDGPVLVEQRTPKLADPDADAWCSFCCRPKGEVGPLVAGPAGAFVCAGCVSLSVNLLSLEDGRAKHTVPAAVGPSSTRSDRPEGAWAIAALPFELPAQLRARTRLTRARPRLALVIGPEGTGKSTWLKSLGTQPDLRRIEVTRALSPEEETELLRWLDAPSRAVFLELRAPVPKPALVLQGEHGDEPIHDTASLVGAVPHLSPALLAKVDAVIAFDVPTSPELERLASSLAEARGVKLPDAAVKRLVQLTLDAKRGAHELATLIARIPPGTYGSS